MNMLRRLFNPTVIEIISEVYMLVAVLLLLWYVSITLDGNTQPELSPTYTGDTAYGYHEE